MPMPPREDQPRADKCRAVTFDPTDRELFDVQRQGFDWQLLQISAVHRYRDTFSLDTACGHLAELGYLVHTLDAGNWDTVGDMHTAIAAALSFPSYYGRNLDAFDDLLSDVADYSYGSDPASAGTVVAFANFDALIELDRSTATAILDIFASHARLAGLYGHAMLCLVDTKDEDLGRGVNAARVMEFPPDLPEPFDESIVVEFVFQCYATPTEADEIEAHLAALVDPVLGAVGRYQTRTQLTSERSGQFDEVHSSSGRTRKPGQDLVDVSVATRGTGDKSLLGDQVFHAVSGHLDFEQMTERSYTGVELEEIFARYPSLV